MSIRAGVADDLDSLDRLWRAYADYQREHGLIVPVPEDAFARWAESLRPGLGRFVCLFLVESEGVPIGFLAGRLRPLPGHYGGEMVGCVSDVYVDPARRRAGYGRALISSARDWFLSQGVRRLELQVVVDNHDAREFYRALGWREELVQMVWLESPTS